MNRKLIRPNMGEIKEKIKKRPKPSAADADLAGPAGCEAPSHSLNGIPSHGTSSARRKIAPPEQTNAESFYYLKQMQSKTSMVVVLQDGEKIRGVIEWYDKHCLKINRAKEPNILLPKHSIKYLYKQEDEPRQRRFRSEKESEHEAHSQSGASQNCELPEH
jgi:sRNA-binding regulator protein Hfq